MNRKTNERHFAKELPDQVRDAIKRFHRYYNPDIKLILDAGLYWSIAIILFAFAFAALDYYNADNGPIVFMLFMMLFVMGMIGTSRASMNVHTVLTLVRENYFWSFGKVTAKDIKHIKRFDSSVEDHYILTIDGETYEAVNPDDFKSAKIGDEFIKVKISDDHRYCINSSGIK